MAEGKDVGVLDQKRQDGSCVQALPLSPSSPSSPSTPCQASSSAATRLTVTGPTTTSNSLERAPTYEEATQGTEAVPTVDSPFNFPATTELPPSYQAHAEAEAEAEANSSSTVGSKAKLRPIAIPQIAPDPAAPFLSAYPPSLLAHGITSQAWHSFLDTVSAFLTAKVSDRAIAHAGDMAKSLSGPPKNYGKSLVDHTKTVGRQIAKDAKSFNIFAVTATFIGGAISIPMHLAFGAVHTLFEIPATAISAISKTPRTPLQRAATYAAIADKDWLNARGLHAVLLDTKELADMIHVPADKFLEMAAEGGKLGTAAATMAALDGHVEKLKVAEDDEVVVLNRSSLWLVLVPVVTEEDGTARE